MGFQQVRVDLNYPTSESTLSYSCIQTISDELDLYNGNCFLPKTLNRIHSQM